MDKELKNHRIIFRVTEKEKQSFDKKVKQANTTASDMLRERVLKDEYFIVAREPKASVDKKQLMFLFNKTSNNMNQLAHLANSYNQQGILSEAQLNQILSQLITLKNLMKAGIDNVD